MTNNTSSTGIIIVVIANSLIHLDDIFFFSIISSNFSIRLTLEVSGAS